MKVCNDKIYLWRATIVRHVMLRPENAGDLIQNRSKVKSYKVHKKVAIPGNDWIIIKNAIPAIYTREE